MKQRGFTLFELLITLGLMACIFIIGFGYYALFSGTLVRLELDTLYMIFLQLNRTAIIDGKEHVLYLDKDKNTVRYDGTEHILGKGTKFGAGPNIKGPPSSPQFVIHDPITFPGHMVIFYPDGHIQSGTIYLTNDQGSITFALSSPIADISHLRRYHHNHTWALL